MKFLRMQCHALENVTPSLYKVTPYISVTSCIYIYIYIYNKDLILFFALQFLYHLKLCLVYCFDMKVKFFDMNFNFSAISFELLKA